MVKVFFQPSESCRSLNIDEIGFILDVLWEQHKDIKIAAVVQESDWSIRLETQRYIDSVSEYFGTSMGFHLTTPKITLISLDEWNEQLEPASAFQGILPYRRFLIVREYYRVFRIPNKLFIGSDKVSINNRFIHGLVDTEWMTTDMSFQRTK